jgi:hypothetical protein
MKNILKTGFGLLAIVGLSVLISCDKESDFALNDETSSEFSDDVLKARKLYQKTIYGSAVSIGMGEARAYIVGNKMGEPLSVGIRLSQDALDNLPSEKKTYMLPIPRTEGLSDLGPSDNQVYSEKSLYDHVLLIWNPQNLVSEHTNSSSPNIKAGKIYTPGQAGTYSTANFDVRFYIISNAEREEISHLNAPAFGSSPGDEFIPPLYAQRPGRNAEIGAEWVDQLKPELIEGSFTKTFNWGSNNGDFVFWGPRVSIDYLKSNQVITTAIRQPDEYKHFGWYASNYKVSYSIKSQNYTIALTDMVYRPIYDNEDVENPAR